jgi:hypothetical protein
MLVHYSEEPNGNRASITLDRDRDGQADFTFESDARGATYSTTGNKPQLHFDAPTAQAMTDAVRRIIQYGGTKTELYHRVADFVQDPTTQGLRTFLLYAPLRNTLVAGTVSVPAGSRFVAHAGEDPAPGFAMPPIVWYGTR